MAVTENNYTGNGSETNYSFTFEYLDEADIKVSLNGANTTAYTLATATTISFNTAPANGVAIRIFRETDSETPVATFYPGSAIRAQDLNDNQSQVLYVAQETLAAVVNAQAGEIADGSIGTSKLAVGAVTNDRIQDDAVTSSKILNGTIVNEDINASAAITYSKLNLSNGIVNADVNSTAAIGYSKLNLLNGIVNADVNSAAAIGYSKLNLANSILNADINSSAGIAHSKLANLTSGQVLLGNASNVPTATALSGAITVSNTGVTTLGSGVVGASNLVVGAGTSGQYLSTNGSQIVWASAGQLSTVSAVNASGTVVEITGVPSWAKEIIIDYQDLNTTTATPCSIQVGTSSGYFSTGAYYGKVRSQSSIQDLNSAPGFRLTTTAWAGNTYYSTGSLSIKQSGYSWIAVGQGALTNTGVNEMYFTTGFVSSISSLPTLTKIQFYIDGSANVSVTYRVTYKG